MLESSQVHSSIEAESATPSQPPPSRPSQAPVNDTTTTTTTAAAAAAAASTAADYPVLQHSPWAAISSGRAPTQFVQSLDRLEGFSAQLFGTSAESDPWLLRHCSFDDAGVKCFYKVHFRNAGGVPVPLKIPIHFMVAADDLAEGAKNETRVNLGVGSSNASRQELNTLVPQEYGQRLVGLYVYPSPWL